MTSRLKVRKNKIIIPILLFLVVMLGIVLLVNKKFSIGNRTINSNISQTISVQERWKTYSDEKIGFSFEVPLESSVVANRYGNYFTISIPNSNLYFSVDNYREIDGLYPLSDKNIKVRKQIIIDGKMKGWQILRENDMNPVFTLSSDFIYPSDNKRFILSTEQIKKDNTIVYDKFITEQEIYHHILTTFSCCSISKQTYTNKYYGYSLIVPTDWKVTDGGYGKNVEINSLGISGNTITLAIDNNGPYMFNDNQSIYPIQSSTIKPESKESVMISGKQVNSFIFMRKDGSRVQILEIELPNKHKLTIFTSTINSEQSTLDSIKNIITTLSY